MRVSLSILFGLTVAAHASVLTVTFSPNPLAGSPGATLHFTGTLENNTGSEVFINNDSFSFAIAGALDDTPFFNNAPISLTAFQTSSPFIFFDVHIPSAQAVGSYDGVFTVLGGADVNAEDNLGAGAFEVQVAPEPATWWLLGCAALAFIGWRRMQAHLARRAN